jgi:succinyl-diaminopimelate desuccinylase
MKEKIFNWIDNSVELAIELETELTKRPAISPDSGGEGELDKVVFLEGWLRSRGITQLERYDASDSRAKGGVRPNVIAVIEGSRNDGALWLISHTDIVPPGEMKLWDSDPYKAVVNNTRIIGRGTEDNHQGLVSSVLAALAFCAQGIKPARTIKLLFAADEETGSSYGIDWLVKNHSDLFSKNDMALIPDGGDAEGASIEISEKNILWIQFTTHGKQTHGSRPDTGINAHLAACDLVLRLHRELSLVFSDRDPLFDPDYSTFQPTKKEANVPNINTIPGEDIFCMDMRILPHYPVSVVLAEIDKIIKTVDTEYGVTIEYSLAQRMESKSTAKDALVVKKLEQAISEIYGVKAKPVGFGGGTIAAYLRNIGIDSAVWAKLGNSMHQPNEYALIGSIIGDAKVMACLAL